MSRTTAFITTRALRPVYTVSMIHQERLRQAEARPSWLSTLAMSRDG
jgi:hypothetical protein